MPPPPVKLPELFTVKVEANPPPGFGTPHRASATRLRSAPDQLRPVTNQPFASTSGSDRVIARFVLTSIQSPPPPTSWVPSGHCAKAVPAAFPPIPFSTPLSVNI